MRNFLNVTISLGIFVLLISPLVTNAQTDTEVTNEAGLVISADDVTIDIKDAPTSADDLIVAMNVKTTNVDGKDLTSNVMVKDTSGYDYDKPSMGYYNVSFGVEGYDNLETVVLHVTDTAEEHKAEMLVNDIQVVINDGSDLTDLVMMSNPMVLSYVDGVLSEVNTPNISVTKDRVLYDVNNANITVTNDGGYDNSVAGIYYIQLSGNVQDIDNKTLEVNGIVKVEVVNDSTELENKDIVLNNNIFEMQFSKDYDEIEEEIGAVYVDNTQIVELNQDNVYVNNVDANREGIYSVIYTYEGMYKLATVSISDVGSITQGMYSSEITTDYETVNLSIGDIFVEPNAEYSIYEQHYLSPEHPNSYDENSDSSTPLENSVRLIKSGTPDIIFNDVDTSKAGTYHIVFFYRDSDGTYNYTEASKVIEVNVAPNPQSITDATITSNEATVKLSDAPREETEVIEVMSAKAVDYDGSDISVSIEKINPAYDYDNPKIGDYNVVFSTQGASGVTVKSENVLHVVDEESNLITDDNSDEDNKDIAVTGTRIKVIVFIMITTIIMALMKNKMNSK